MGIVVIGAVFVDIKGYPLSTYIPGGRNAGRIEQVHGGVSRNVVEDIANVELRPTFVGLVDDTGMGQDVIDKLAKHKVNTHFFYHAISKQRQPHLVDGRVDPGRQQRCAPKPCTQQNILQVRSAFPTAQRLLCLVFLPCNQACININCHL